MLTIPAPCISRDRRGGLFHASLNTWPNTIYILEAEGTIGPYLSTTIIYTGWALQLIILGLIRGGGDRRKPEDATPAVAA